MYQHSRRQFLTHSATAAGMLALLAGRPSAGRRGGRGKTLDMTIARWAGAKAAAEADMKQIAVKLTEKAIEGLGGMKRFVSSGDVVWVKPNIGWDRTPGAGRQHQSRRRGHARPALLRGRREDGQGGRQPLQPAPPRATRPAASPPAAKDAGRRSRVPRPQPLQATPPSGASGSRRIPIYPEVIECDLVINVPIVKHHCLSDSDAVHEELHGRDREPQRRSTRTFPPAWPT